MREAYIEDDEIRIYFWIDKEERFQQIKDIVKQIDGRKFVKIKGNSHWSAPAGLVQCQQVVELLTPLKFQIDPEIKAKALEVKRRRKAKTKKISVSKFDERLYPFQAQAVEFLVRTQGRALIADEMGLGKTVEALTWVNIDKPRTIVVAPANVVYKWKVECGTWTDMSSTIIKTQKQKLDDADIHIMSYEIMRNKIEELEYQYVCSIFDEVHYLKNQKAKRSKAARRLANTDHVIGLSGFPIINRPAELYNFLSMLDPVSYGDWWPFAFKFCGAQKNYFGWDFSGATNQDELREQLEAVMIRRLKQDVLEELPELQRIYMPVDIRNMKEYWTELAEIIPKLKIGGGRAIGEMSRLRRILGEGKALIALDWVKEWLHQHADHEKLVVYCHHHSVVDTIQKGLEGYGTLSITGKTPQTKRPALVDAFQRGGPRVMVITSAGGEGIDLFGKEGKDCSTILFVERQYTPAMEEQAEARLHRLGQTTSVSAYYLVANDTIDEDLSYMIENKRKVIKGSMLLYDYSEEEDKSVIQELINSMVHKGQS